MRDFNVYVIHVRGQEKRKQHIQNMLDKFNLNFEFILDGNIEDINQERLDQYFCGEIYPNKPAVSCALKHILAYQDAIKNNYKSLLIFEDDIILKPNFIDIFEKIQREINTRNLSNYLISLENTNHNYVKKRELAKNQILYKKTHSRCTGAYFIDLECAKSIISEVQIHKCNRMIDWFQNDLSIAGKIQVYWSYPHIAEQASHNGKLGSLIDHKKNGWFRRFTYFLQGEIKKRWAPIHP